MGPAITQHPVNQSAIPGGSNTFTVTAWGDAPLQYHWSFNGTKLALTTNSAFTLTNVQSPNLGVYSVLVTNFYGAATSNPALLTAADTNYLKLNISAPGQLSFQCWQGMVFDTESSTNLTDWSFLVTLTNLAGALDYFDAEASQYPSRFYRSVIH
jgi:hypothetical protein